MITTQEWRACTFPAMSLPGLGFRVTLASWSWKAFPLPLSQIFLSPFTAPCGPCHLLNSIDYVRNQTTLPATTQGDAQSEDYIFPTRYKEKQRYPVPLNESLVLLCIYNTNTKPLGAFLSPSEVAHLPCGVGSEHGFAASTLYLDLLSLLLIIEEHPLRAATLNDYYSLSLFILQLQAVCVWLSPH